MEEGGLAIPTGDVQRSTNRARCSTVLLNPRHPHELRRECFERTRREAEQGLTAFKQLGHAVARGTSP
ncbi:hypothetical protein MYSTI_02377 [Myxococcus stipitatus DSM 14675]|uniref:Uncharacterized protein n=1 Tax=Myxococcus stipitatus (strain DSM 14675 / JCM 12634 / Mx s8) TaxID=1278073 RepID=L7U6E1_MYXSD|nr:hypothetical protein MYSTI_02377 [Myxococcus stipitatus DSM 14675]